MVLCGDGRGWQESRERGLRVRYYGEIGRTSPSLRCSFLCVVSLRFLLASCFTLRLLHLGGDC